MANDPRVLKLLPLFVSSQYPCILTRKKGVSHELMNLVEELAVEIPMTKLHNILEINYAKHFTTSHLQFLSYLDYIRSTRSMYKHDGRS
jgi:hypothetical protein